MPDYYREVVYNLTPEMKADPSRFYYKAKRDFHYDRLISEPMTAFCSHWKKWKDEAKTKQYGFSHIRKYHDADAILKCSEYSGGSHVSQEYRDEMNAYIESMKREKTVAKQNNQIEEKEADPIGIDLYSDIAKWAIEEGTPGGILIWASSVTQWNCKADPSVLMLLAWVILPFPSLHHRRSSVTPLKLPKLLWSRSIHLSFQRRVMALGQSVHGLKNYVFRRGRGKQQPRRNWGK